MWLLVDFLFFYMVVLGSVIVLTSSSWFVMWVGFEINMSSFIGLVGSGGSLGYEGIFSYFFVQSVGSLLLVFFCLLGGGGLGWGIGLLDLFVINLVIMVVLMMKMGAGPLYFWFPVVVDGFSWMNVFILMTWQSIGPLWVLGLMVFDDYLYLLLGLISVMLGSIGGLNQLMLRSIFAFSSVSHMGWMIILAMVSEEIMIVYFFCYFVLNFGVIVYFFGGVVDGLGDLYCGVVGWAAVFGFFFCLFSLGGMPPFFGFFPSLVGLQVMVDSVGLMVLFVLIVVGLFGLYYYLRLMYAGVVSSLGVVGLDFLSGGGWMFFFVFFSLFFFPFFIFIY